MKTVGPGAFGLLRGSIPASTGVRAPLRRLHGAQDVTMLSQLEGPPLLRGITWSTVRCEVVPQYWQVHESRANTALRVMRRLARSRGTRTYVTSLITTGRGNVTLSACRDRSPSSSSSAFSLRISTTARRTEHTFRGS